MGDVTPNYSLEKQRLELEKDQLKLNIKSQTYRIAQMEDEKTRLEENIVATQKSISALDDQINKLTEK